MRLKIFQAPCDLLQGDEGGQRLSFVDFTGRLITLNPIFGCNQFDSSPGLWAATAASYCPGKQTRGSPQIDCNQI